MSSPADSPGDAAADTSASSSSKSSSTYTATSSPRCVLNLDVAKKNATKMLKIVEEDLGLSFRPHVKTHKTVEGALLQTGGRRSKIVVSTIAELKFYDDAGFADLLYAVPLAGDNKIEYIWKNFVSQNKDIKVVIDHPQQLRLIESWMKKNKHMDESKNSKYKWHVLLMMGVGNELSKNNVLMHQVGLDPTDRESCHLALALHTFKYVEFEGLYIHAAHSYNATTPEECTQIAKEECNVIGTFAKKLRDEWQISCNHVGVGSTPTCNNPAIYKSVTDPDTGEITKQIDIAMIKSIYKDNLITELHAGNYLVYDYMQSGIINSCTQDNVAMFVKAQVISSYPESNTLMVDLGWTGISKQGENEEHPYGVVVSHPELKLKSLKQESGEMKPRDPAHTLDVTKYPIGETEIKIIPYHACAAGHQYRSIFIENSIGDTIDEWIRCPSK